MIIDIDNNKVKKEDAVERFNKSISDLDQLKQKQNTVLRNKMTQVVYQLFNSFGFNKEFAPLFSQIKSEQTEEKMQKPLWFRINKSEFNELTSDIYDNQNNKGFKITINKKAYDLKNAKMFWRKVTTSKISRIGARKLYNELIQKDIDALKREKSNSNKKYVLKILENINVILNCNYFHYKELPKETIFERSIADRIKSGKERFNIINTNKKNINNEFFKEYFYYSSPDTMIERLKDTGDEKNRNMVKSIYKNLNKMKKIIKNMPENKAFKIEENKKIIDIVERILELNSKKQLGQGLKILTPNQMLSRLPITLARLKAGNTSEKLKNEIRQLLYSLCRTKKLTKQLNKSLINIIIEKWKQSL